VSEINTNWSKEVIERFTAFVDDHGKGKARIRRCWPWLGAANEKGYGIFRVSWGVMRAHRMAFLIYHDLPRKAINGVEIRSSPDCIIGCCNPHHLIARKHGKVVQPRSLLGKTIKPRKVRRK
jgi:hypothetical protein